jgi:hypothetical protein
MHFPLHKDVDVAIIEIPEIFGDDDWCPYNDIPLW